MTFTKMYLTLTTVAKRNLEFKGTKDVFDIQQKRMHSNHVCTRWLGIVSHQCEDVCHLIKDRPVQTWIEIGKQHEREHFTFKNLAHIMCGIWFGLEWYLMLGCTSVSQYSGDLSLDTYHSRKEILVFRYSSNTTHINKPWNKYFWCTWHNVLHQSICALT